MKLENVRVIGHTLIPEHQRNLLEVTCRSPWGGTHLVFRVPDNHRNREVYALDRAIDIEVTPGFR